MRDSDILRKLEKVTALYERATSAGEKQAAYRAMERLRTRLRFVEREEKLIECTFKVNDAWSRQLLMALLKRHGLKPYRYSRQRNTTVVVRAAKTFIEGTLWSEFERLSFLLSNRLRDVTDEVIETCVK